MNKWPIRQGSRGDSGMATAELAVALPVLIVLVVAGLGAVNVASAQVRIQDAAREAARSAARGDTATAYSAMNSFAPGAALSLVRTGTLVTARVVKSVHPFGGILPAFSVSASAVAAVEAEMTISPTTSRDTSSLPP